MWPLAVYLKNWGNGERDFRNINILGQITANEHISMMIRMSLKDKFSGVSIIL
jgi:hypothetical protein